MASHGSPREYSPSPPSYNPQSEVKFQDSPKPQGKSLSHAPAPADTPKFIPFCKEAETPEPSCLSPSLQPQKPADEIGVRTPSPINLLPSSPSRETSDEVKDLIHKLGNPRGVVEIANRYSMTTREELLVEMKEEVKRIEERLRLSENKKKEKHVEFVEGREDSESSKELAVLGEQTQNTKVGDQSLMHGVEMYGEERRGRLIERNKAWGEGWWRFPNVTANLEEKIGEQGNDNAKIIAGTKDEIHPNVEMATAK